MWIYVGADVLIHEALKQQSERSGLAKKGHKK